MIFLSHFYSSSLCSYADNQSTDQEIKEAKLKEVEIACYAELIQYSEIAVYRTQKGISSETGSMHQGEHTDAKETELRSPEICQSPAYEHDGSERIHRRRGS